MRFLGIGFSFFLIDFLNIFAMFAFMSLYSISIETPGKF